MTFIFRPVQKAARKVGRGGKYPTKKQLDALRDRMEKAVSVHIGEGMTALKAKVDPKELLRAFNRGNYEDVSRFLPFDDVAGVFGSAKKTLREAAAGGAKIEVDRGLPKGVSKMLRFDVANPNVDDYLNTRIGALVQNVDDDLQVKIQGAVRQGMTNGKTQAQIADDIVDGLPLNNQQQTALNNFQGTAEERAAYAAQLQRQRADMIARTEVSFAMNQGQLAVWDAAKEQDLVPEDAMKVWTVDGKPCPYICEPMDGKRVPIGEEFTLPDGVTVDGPPAHPHCYCLLSLDVGDSPRSNRQNYETPYDYIGSGSDGEPEL